MLHLHPHHPTSTHTGSTPSWQIGLFKFAQTMRDCRIKVRMLNLQIPQAIRTEAVSPVEACYYKMGQLHLLPPPLNQPAPREVPQRTPWCIGHYGSIHLGMAACRKASSPPRTPSLSPALSVSVSVSFSGPHSFAFSCSVCLCLGLSLWLDLLLGERMKERHYASEIVWDQTSSLNGNSSDHAYRIVCIYII